MTSGRLTSDHLAARIMPNPPTVYRNVLVLHRAETGWLCEIEHRSIFIEQHDISPGTSMPGEGLRGPVSVVAAAADRIHAKLRLPTRP